MPISEEFTDPLKRWVVVPRSESKVPSWNKDCLRPEDPEVASVKTEPPSSPVRIDPSLTQWLGNFTSETPETKPKIEIFSSTVIGVSFYLSVPFNHTFLETENQTNCP